jgi:type IV pilus assembly protein PilN
MIRINLLPGAPRKAAKAAGAAAGGPAPTAWFVGYAVASVLVIAGLWLFYAQLSRDLREQVAQNQQLEADIDELERQSADLDDVRAALDESRELEAVVAELQRARFGPTRVLMEVAHILSEAGAPTIDPRRLEELRRENPLAGFNQTWDFHRLWLTSFEEEDREVTIQGVGRTNEDVAELLRRLTLSDLFENVHLTRTEAHADTETHLEFINFELEARVRY